MDDDDGDDAEVCHRRAIGDVQDKTRFYKARMRPD